MILPQTLLQPPVCCSESCPWHRSKADNDVEQRTSVNSHSFFLSGTPVYSYSALQHTALTYHKVKERRPAEGRPDRVDPRVAHRDALQVGAQLSCRHRLQRRRKRCETKRTKPRDLFLMTGLSFLLGQRGFWVLVSAQKLFV